jgi:mutator protein MutT
VSAEIRVLAAVIRRNDRYLLCLRPTHKRHGGLWEFPGGKLEPGESLLDAARRELDEELGMRVRSIGSPLWAMRDPGSVFRIEFVPVDAEGEPGACEHDDVRWVTVPEMSALPLAPSDAEFVRHGLADGRDQPFSG